MKKKKKRNFITVNFEDWLFAEICRLPNDYKTALFEKYKGLEDFGHQYLEGLSGDIKQIITGWAENASSSNNVNR